VFADTPVTVRRAVAGAATAVQPYVRGVARQMLRSHAFTRALNAVEERAGRLVLYPRRDFRMSDLAVFLFHAGDVPEPFEWTCRLDVHAFRVPVDPLFPRPAPGNDPWGPATYWSRATNRKIREFYELYLRRRPSGTFLDIGANWGMHTYPFAASGYECVCFEPQTICCQFIRRVADLNGFAKVAIVRCAVGAASCDAVPFFESEVEAFSSMDERHVAAYQRPWRTSTIACVSLDSHCRAHGLAPSFLKIDTEGFEWEVLQGAAALLQECRPGLLVEVSTSIEKQHAMWSALSGAGYRCYAIDRALGARYPKQPFARISSAAEFVKRGIGDADGGTYEGDADFIFLQPHDDVLAGA
jgi:FkbM family methyltransferase